VADVVTSTAVPAADSRLSAGRAPRWVRGIYLANLVAQAAIIVTGAVVRLTGSGLGCPTWPQCTDGSYVPTHRQEQGWHKYIEFGNRTLTFVLVIVAVAAILAALWDARRRARAGLPARPALTVLAFVPFAATVAQAVLGGITVLTGLSPVSVSAHFSVSMVIVAGTVALVARSADPGDRPIVPLAPRPVRALAWALVAVTAVVVLLGVLVTGSGPHSGDATAENRYPFDPRTVSWLHADVVLLFLGLAVGLLVCLAVLRGPAQAQRRTWLLVGVAAAQGLLGYAQYFAGLPEVLVMIHVLGATVVWVAVLFIPPSLRTRGIESAADRG